MNVRTFVVSGLLLLAPLGSAAQDAATAPAAGPRLVVEPPSFDFGKVLASTNERAREVSKEFTLRNAGSQDLVIENVSTTCGCTVAEGYDKVVKPGRSTSMLVKVNLPRLAGPIEKAVLVRSNDPQNKSLSIKLQATLTPSEK